MIRYGIVMLGLISFVMGYGYYVNSLNFDEIRQLQTKVDRVESQLDTLTLSVTKLFDAVNDLDYYSEPVMVSPEWRTTEREWAAICYVESRFEPEAKHPEGAVGIAQIKRVCVDDINRICGYEAYTYEDRYDPIKSREMFETYTGYYANANSFEDRARVWHSGPSKEGSDTYWERVRKYLNG